LGKTNRDEQQSTARIRSTARAKKRGGLSNSVTGTKERHLSPSAEKKILDGTLSHGRERATASKMNESKAKKRDGVIEMRRNTKSSKCGSKKPQRRPDSLAEEGEKGWRRDAREEGRGTEQCARDIKSAYSSLVSWKPYSSRLGGCRKYYLLLSNGPRGG